ncbi:ankyrin repeat-containing protein At2g01680 [Amborella trichopoda]|uniref:PGG domain-containing protein n=1 Tax=Amborella trichopoda TaxID=13333 RepID=W1NKW8_AMBTC|nr:ankyrin repeat-containing protein At2g01680 [Amborella trichopoda]ERM95855.1 hypothetical protein AMTR_s00060p00113920 [Amborella trichopoda]|eukprot:XP_006828439.1 ankyrin repeat-containing protein At2g01680 [Amborella trichopoda]
MDSKNLVFRVQNLHSAVRSGDLEAVKSIVESETGDGAAGLMAAKNDAGETALYIAVQTNRYVMVKYLVGFCNLEIAELKSRVGINALHVAAKGGCLATAKELLSLWPSLCKSCDPSNTTPLYFAAILDHLDVVNAILDTDDSSIRIVRKNGKTSLHMAARTGLLSIVRALLHRDPGIASIKDKKGQTALHMAVKGKNIDVVEELLNADISILNARDKKGNTALHMATRKWRSEMVTYLLSDKSIDINAVNNLNQTAMDIAEKLQYGESALEITESLADAGAKTARNINQSDEAIELNRTVSSIKHEVHTQLLQNAKTNRRVSGIAKELKKLHREAVSNTTNSVTVVAVLIASIAFMSIFNLPGQYLQKDPDMGQATIAGVYGFHVFCLLNAVALFISLAVVVVQITLVAWETSAQKQVVSVVNKLMWVACLSTCGAFLSIAFVVVGRDGSSFAIVVTCIGGPIFVGTLVSMCYFVLRQHLGKWGDDSQRRIKRASGSKSFSLSIYTDFSDPDAYDSDHNGIYAL